MSWLQRLVETYDACFGKSAYVKLALTPINHVEQQAHLEITLDKDGEFLRASVVPKEATLIPATEASAGRTSGPVAHPLCDKLRYVAKDYGSNDHELYRSALDAWVKYSEHPKLKAIKSYVAKGTTVHDLVAAGIVVMQSDGTLESAWNDGPSPLAKLLTADPKTKLRDQGNALVRWKVELAGSLQHSVWEDTELQKSWAEFHTTLPAEEGFSLYEGENRPLALSHPKRLRHGGDGAKLISSNDSGGFTFRGRFMSAKEAYGLSAEATQKAHNALRWLIARQGYRNGDQVIVAWSVQHVTRIPLLADSRALLGEEDEDVEEGYAECSPPSITPENSAGDVGQEYALRLKSAMQGYRSHIGDSDNIVVMSLDAATPGRMAIVYYRELTGSELLARIERWHSLLAWQQNFGKDHHFVGAPAPRDIAEAAYGRRVDDKLRRATVERLLPCIVDGTPLPRDLVLSCVQRATNRIGMERWEFERVLGIACSLYRGSHPQEFPSMSLDEARTSRDYLYGRLLAVADNIESMALSIAREPRETNAARFTQRFADHPYTTWRTLELQLRPYIARLNGSRYVGALKLRQQLLDRIYSSFETVNGESTFLDNRRLSGEFLLGFHSQREALRPSRDAASATTTTQTDVEGDTE
ncbi:MAG: type I-C CRISPR-associated protein Cas8c/Csd1 [Acidobacteriaceae bacterium]|nr:type I-C CRISPR-associated protein Cas8c/Csd1 [Acidobacteriaceae bacterium]